jgi:hypothetical protein
MSIDATGAHADPCRPDAIALVAIQRSDPDDSSVETVGRGLAIKLTHERLCPEMCKGSGAAACSRRPLDSRRLSLCGEFVFVESPPTRSRRRTGHSSQGSAGLGQFSKRRLLVERPVWPMRQLTLARLGAGSMPCVWRTFQTLLDESENPSPVSSPWMRCSPSPGSPPPEAGSAVASERQAAAGPADADHTSSDEGRGRDASAAGSPLDQVGPPFPRQQLAERPQERTIGRPQTRPPELPPQYVQLMSQHHDLKLLRPIWPPALHHPSSGNCDRPMGGLLADLLRSLWDA